MQCNPRSCLSSGILRELPLTFLVGLETPSETPIRRAVTKKQCLEASAARRYETNIGCHTSQQM